MTYSIRGYYKTIRNYIICIDIYHKKIKGGSKLCDPILVKWRADP